MKSKTLNREKSHMAASIDVTSRYLSEITTGQQFLVRRDFPLDARKRA